MTNDKRKRFSLLELSDFDKRRFVRSTSVRSSIYYSLLLPALRSFRFESNYGAFRREIFQYFTPPNS